MKRRTFLAASGAVAGLAPLSAWNAAASDGDAGRDFLQLRQYQVENQAQRDRLDAYLRDAAIPALNRLGVKPVGVFYPRTELGPVWVLLRHASADVLLNLEQRLLADPDYARLGADALQAVTGNAAYQRMESSLLMAFAKMPHVETPVSGPERVFQLRIYESPSVAMGLKKIEMFNDAGEINIFRRVGLIPVFFGQTLVGGKMPNLTYMLGFPNAAAQDAAWKAFREDPDWLALRARPEFADKTVLCGITNLLLKPAEYSQI